MPYLHNMHRAPALPFASTTTKWSNFKEILTDSIQTTLAFVSNKNKNIKLSAFYLSLKGSNYRGVADAPIVPAEDFHGKVGGMIRPTSSVVESE